MTEKSIAVPFCTSWLRKLRARSRRRLSDLNCDAVTPRKDSPNCLSEHKGRHTAAEFRGWGEGRQKIFCVESDTARAGTLSQTMTSVEAVLSAIRRENKNTSSQTPGREGDSSSSA